ncbi:MAG TPA: phosphate acyltransferase, partial [Acidobacteriota bacterium]|nr:phosphate acyltransferase [Acidobacteriota bacterium]
MEVLDQIRRRAAERPRRIVFPEAEEARTLHAVVRLAAEKIAMPVLLGDPQRIHRVADREKVNLSGVEIVDPATSGQLRDLSRLYYERVRARGITEDEAGRQVLDPVYFGALLVASGVVDGSVSGAVHTTAETVRAALRCIGLREGISIVSSFFLM